MIYLISLLIMVVPNQRVSGIDRAYAISYEKNQLSVKNITDSFPPHYGPGILVWSDLAGNHFWQSRRKPLGQVAPVAPESRSAISFSSQSFQQYTQSAPVLDEAQLRGLNFLTPPPGKAFYHASPQDRPVLRRLPENGKFAALKLGLHRLGSQPVPFQIRTLNWVEGSDRLELEPLSPGDYRISDGAISVTFTVVSVSAEFCPRAMELPMGCIGPSVTGCRDLVMIQELSNLENGSGLWSALDRCERLSRDNRGGKGLSLLAESLSNRLLELQPGAKPSRDMASLSAALAEPTKIAGIDQARLAIQNGRFKEAEDSLKPLLVSAEKRERGLAWLYWAILLAESGEADRDQVVDRFSKAFNLLNGTADAYRLRSARAQHDARIAAIGFNDALPRMAAGLHGSLTNSISVWLTAWDEMAGLEGEKAGGLDMSLDKIQLLSAMASLVASLSVPEESSELVSAIQSQAESIATRIDHSKAGSIYQGVLVDLGLSELALRNDPERAASLAVKAANESVRQGYLPGLENALRLVGQSRISVAKAEGKGRIATARPWLEASRSVTRLLADQTPKTNLGRWLSGFLARRAFVMDLLVEVCLAAGDETAALRHLEEMKTEAYSRLLYSLGKKETKRREVTEKVLADWPADLTALEYYLGDSGCWVFVVSPGKGGKASVKAVRLKDSAGRDVTKSGMISEVVAVQSAMNHWVRKNTSRLLSGTPVEDWQGRLHSLARVLVPPAMLADLRKSSHVLIIPHHVLHYLPFGALVLEPCKGRLAAGQLIDKPVRFLVDEEFHCFQAPSITSWQLGRKMNPGSVEARAVGLVEVPGQQPLPNVRVDMENFRRRFKPYLRDVLDDPGPDVGGMIKLLGKPGILMVATHGNNDPENPLESHLYLMPDHAHADGRMLASEIAQRSTRYDLVVLSACYSGLGAKAPPPGDDLLGLQRVFLETGSAAVLAGLWDIADRTAPDLVDRFHEGILEGKTFAQAWHASQRRFLEVARSGKDVPLDHHPYFWAVLNLSGDGLRRITR